MAGINFWDRSLSDQDISELFKSCASGKGNIISMADLHGMGEVEKISVSCKSEWADKHCWQRSFLGDLDNYNQGNLAIWFEIPQACLLKKSEIGFDRLDYQLNWCYMKLVTKTRL